MDGWSWLLEAAQPWVRERALVELKGRPVDDPDVTEAHEATLSAPQFR